MKGSQLTFQALRDANVARDGSMYDNLVNWNVQEWGNAIGGEFGEAAERILMMFKCLVALDRIKKIHRLVDTDTTLEIEYRLREHRKELAKEFADIIMYTDLAAEMFDIDLGQAVVEKFNEISARKNVPITL